MKSTCTFRFLALVMSPILLFAWPMVPESPNNPDLLPRRPATYSVVPVAGSSTDSSADTVTQPPVTSTAIIISTSIFTTIITEDAQATTIYNTIELTLLQSTTVFQTTSVTPATITSTDYPSPVPATASSVVTEVPETIYVTVQPSPTSTVTTLPYDNGQWHTTYYYTVPASNPSATPSSEIFDEGYYTPVSTSSATYDNSTANSTSVLRPRWRH